MSDEFVSLREMIDEQSKEVARLTKEIEEFTEFFKALKSWVNRDNRD